MRWTIGKYDGYRLYLISCMDRYSVYLTYTHYTLVKEIKLKLIFKYLFLICMCGYCYANEIVIVNKAFMLNDKMDARVSFKRVIDDSVSGEMGEFGREVIEIFSKKGNLLFRIIDDYVNREDIIVDQGEVKLIYLEGYTSEFIIYIRTTKGVGTGAEGSGKSYSILGWNGDRIDVLFKINVYEYSHVKPRFYTGSDGKYDQWQPEEFNKIERIITFDDRDIDGKADITVLEKIYEKTNKMIEAPNSFDELTTNDFDENITIKKRSVHHYVWDGRKFTLQISTPISEFVTKPEKSTLAIRRGEAVDGKEVSQKADKKENRVLCLANNRTY